MNAQTPESEAIAFMEKIRAQWLEERSAPSLTDAAEIVRQLVIDLWPKLETRELTRLAVAAVTLELRARESRARSKP